MTTGQSGNTLYGQVSAGLTVVLRDIHIAHTVGRRLERRSPLFALDGQRRE
jgi:hypothetical protein